MKVKEESEKVGLKFSIQKTNIMASGPLTSWQTDGEAMETITDSRTRDICPALTPLATPCPVVMAAIQDRHVNVDRKSMTNLDSILKSRDITLPTKVCLA